MCVYVCVGGCIYVWCMHVSVCTCVQMIMHLYMYVCIWKNWHWRSSTITLHLSFLKQELSLKLELTDWLDYLTNKLQGLPVSTLLLGLLTFIDTTSFPVGDRNPGSGPHG